MSELATGAETKKMTGGQAVVETLKSEKVKHVFGIISIHMLPVYDALRAQNDIELIIPRHEMSGGFMADGYSRASGREGVYLSSTGPGAANTMGAVIESWAASSKTLQITSQIQSYNFGKGRGMLHEVKDQAGMFNATGACAQHANTAMQIPYELRRAFHSMRSARPVPQIVEIPIDQQYISTDIDLGKELPITLPELPGKAVDNAVDLLVKAKRPVLWLGGGANRSGARQQITELAEALGAAVFTTRGGRGTMNDEHPLVIGNYFGERPAREYLQEADAIIAIGTKFSWHSTSEWGIKLTPKLIRVDIDPNQLDHNYKADVHLNADATEAALALTEALKANNHKPAESLADAIQSTRDELRSGFRNIRPLTAELMDRLDKVSPKNKILVTDSTIPAYWGANQYLPVRAERGFMTQSLAAIGPGYPMALGAQAVDRDRPVLCIAGDGGFQMHLSEMAAAVQHKLNVVTLVFNNQGYGVLKMLQQQMMGGREFAVDLHTPDFAAVAKGFGVEAETVKTPEDFESAVKRGFEAKAPYLIDVQSPFES